jgi:trehalose 6-phosphate synthase/phosphatase
MGSAPGRHYALSMEIEQALSTPPPGMFEPAAAADIERSDRPAVGRVILVSHRLPVSVRVQAGRVHVLPSSGGVATALDSVHRSGAHVWIGTAGDDELPAGEDHDRIRASLACRRLQPLFLNGAEHRGYYRSFANGVLWPVFHYMPDRIPLESCGWNAYRRVNATFADAVAQAYRDGDIVWIHDYQLMLVPQLVRERIPDASIGFFLHIPFPSFEAFRTLPWARPLLTGMLGADVIGFHTAAYARYFTRASQRLLGIDATAERARVGGRIVRLQVSPLGVDVDAFERLARSPAVQRAAADIRAGAGGRRLMIGIDRVDYTKGIPHRLLAFERLLARDPALRDSVRLIQVAVPCRAGIESYRMCRRQLNELVGRINGAHATPDAVPVHVLNHAISPEELVALYIAADVMAVTPLRDGMNLVAKEFVASRIDDDGVLLLSEFAGAHEELSEALSVNPYDIDGTADVMDMALQLSRDQRALRMRALRQRVAGRTVRRWAAAFVDDIRTPAAAVASRAIPGVDDTLRRRLAEICTPVLLLDYDGTLVPFAAVPDLARPDGELLALLDRLGARHLVHVVSGRDRRDLDRWFGDLRVRLWAEHGAWLRRATGSWDATLRLDVDWLEHVRGLMTQTSDSTPGSLIEEKSASLAWHYRGADAEWGARQAVMLTAQLRDASRGRAFEVLVGAKVIEARARGVSKAVIVRRLLASGVPASRIVAIGDDRTDEDMFAALPDDAVTVGVGRRRTAAQYTVADPGAVRDLLRAVAARADT